jgi:hypothetical protein
MKKAMEVRRRSNRVQMEAAGQCPVLPCHPDKAGTLVVSAIAWFHQASADLRVKSPMKTAE